ncbi:MAG: mechanosensitive ion channel family protein [Patescibacteria group bacterium]
MTAALKLIQPYLTKLHSFIFWGIRADKYAIALGVLILILIVSWIWKRHILRHFKKLAKKTATDLDDTLVAVLDEVPSYFYFFVGLFVAFYFLGVKDKTVIKMVDEIFLILVAFRVIAILQKFINYTLRKVWTREDGKLPEEKETALHGIKILTSIVLWSSGFLILLSSLGFEISTLAASLGIGGVAIAFALQNVLGDLFSSFAIYFDKPFQIGDAVMIGNDAGTVKKIGLKTTRITTLQGEELVISNAELTSTRIKNFKKMKKRRIVFNLGVVYSTPLARLKKIPEIIQKIIEKIELAEFDRVHFFQFSDSSLNFEIVYFVKSREYLDYMNTQQTINFGIKEAFEKEKIEMAFPSQTVYLQK